MALLTNGNGVDEAAVVNGALLVSPVAGVLNQEFGAASVVQPSGLTAGLVYSSFRNSNASRNVRLKSIILHSGFSGTAANSASLFALAKFTGVVSGGTPRAILPLSQQAVVSAVDVRDDPSGIIVTSAVIGNHFFILGSSNIQHGGTQTTLEFDNFILAPGEGIALVAVSAIVAGQRVSISYLWEEF